MKKLRKFAALVMALMMFATLLAACGDKNLRLSLAVEDGVTSVAPGGSAKFTATVVEGETDSIVYSITAGSEHATIDSSTGDLDVLPTAQYGATISVVATSGEVTSNTVSITVASPSLTSVTISANASDKVVAGQQISFSAVVAPSTISGATVVYTVNGAAAINGNVMTVNADAAEDSVISVKATATYDGKSVESNTLTFTVIPLTDTDYSISIVDENLTVDKYGTAQVIEAEIYDGTHKVEGVDVSYQITSGSEYIDVNYQTGSVTAKGHGTATVTVSIAGTTESATCTIKSIVPPDAISMPSNLQNVDSNVEFAFGLHDYADGSVVNTAALAFEPTIGGTNVCQDYTVTFLENGVAKDDIAEYDSETKEISFKRTGTFTISVVSDSGSVRETPFSREIIINDGINVDTLEEFVAVMNNESLQNNTIYQNVNIYGTLSSTAQTATEINSLAIVSFGDRYIHGNGNVIDLSKVKILTIGEWGQPTNYTAFPDFMRFRGYGSMQSGIFVADSSRKTFDVQIFNLSIISNLDVTKSVSELDLPTPIPDGGIGENTPANRVLRRGIHINAEHAYYDHDGQTGTAEIFNEANAQICTNMILQDVSVYGFYIGTTLQSVADGTITDCSFGGAYASSMDILCSNITFTGTNTFTKCGVAGLELSERYGDEAPVFNGSNWEFTGRTTINFEGMLDFSDCWADGASNHMAYDDTLNQFNMLLQGNLMGYSDEAISNIQRPTDDNERYEINWLIFVEGSDSDKLPVVTFNEESIGTVGDGDTIDTVNYTDRFIGKTVYYNPESQSNMAGYIYVGNINYGANN